VTPGRWLAAGTVLCAVLAILSAPWALGQPLLNVLFKPLATIGLIALAWPRGADAPDARRWVRVGLLASLAGDVALLWPQQGFLPGLLSFLLAHLAYLRAFTRVQRLAAVAWPFLAYAAVAGLILWPLWPGVPPALRGPVGAYVACLAAMGAQAAVLWRSGAARGGRLALGGALFVASDALLAWNRFADPLPAASLLVLAPYWSAQACIAAWLAPQVRAAVAEEAVSNRTPG
jgi:uncharacterized membrane protein YhhN